MMRCALLAVALAAVSLAQSPTATLVGRIEDASGAGVAQAVVRARNLDTNAVHETRCADDGGFTLPNLPPGHYEIAVEKPGFHKAVERDRELQVDQTARLELKLTVGSLMETVEVQATPPPLNTDSWVKGNVIVSQEITEMPLNGRDFADLAFLVPGVARRAQGGQASQFAINGARGDNTNFLIDGFNDRNQRGGAAQARPPLDALLEFKMQVTGYPAEYGRLAGGVQNMVLKSGGNRLNATLFEFLRNDVFDARNFFDVGKEKLRRNQFGGVLSGPVFLPRLYNGRNRTFFLATWESYRQVEGSTRLGRVPTERERDGDFSETRDVNGAVVRLKDPFSSNAFYTDGRLPRSRISQVALNATPYYPLANRPDQVNNFVGAANDDDIWDSFLYKIDHRFRTQDTLSYRWLKRYNNTTSPFSGGNLAQFGSRVYETQMLTGAAWTHIFGPATINEFRAGMTRTTHYEPGFHAGADFTSQLGITGATTDPKLIGFPRITIRDLTPLGDSVDTPIEFTVNGFEWADTMTLVRSRHLVKFGGDVLRSQFFQSANNNNRGTYNFLGRWTNAGYADFLLGLLNNSSRRLGTLVDYLFSTDYGLFVQDDWKIHPRLTLNLGLRYELMLPIYEKYGRLANYVPELGRVIVADSRGVPDFEQTVAQARLADKVALARDVGLPAALVLPAKKDFAPRFGFAWRPFSGTRTVLRGGYGIFYGASNLNPIRGDLAVTFPFVTTQSFSRSTTNPSALTLANPFPTARGTIEGITNSVGYQVHPPPQYLESWNLTLERMIGSGTVIEIAYVGSKGTHLPRRYDLNQPFRKPELRLADGTFPRPYAGFNTINYYAFGSNSSYNAGMISVNRNFRNGVFYRINYVYSKSIDDASQITGSGAGGVGGAQDSRNLKGERGRSDFDTGHTFTVNFAWEMPWRRNLAIRGWQISGSGRLYSGQPFTATLANADLSVGEAIRPDRIAKGRLDVRTPERWFDLSAFVPLAAGSFRFGNSGRNILDGPGYAGLNLAVRKQFELREHGALQFRWEVFNVGNHTNFQLPVRDIDVLNAATLTTAQDGRVMQFALKYLF